MQNKEKFKNNKNMKWQTRETVCGLLPELLQKSTTIHSNKKVKKLVKKVKKGTGKNLLSVL